MEARATVKNVRIASRKVQVVLDLIRGQDVTTAFAYLNQTHRGAVPAVRTLLKSAVANADELYPNADIDALVVQEAYVNAGPTLKRFRPRAMGRAARILKRTSHITLIVSDQS